jgi:uncharacterized protein
VLVDRPLYTQRIRRFIDVPMIKVITGVRRSGKSTILQLVRNELLAGGVPPDRVLFVNMESLQFEHLRDHRALYDYVKERLPGSDRAYLFVDEVQNIREWERAIGSIYTEDVADIIVSGSNAQLLSSDLATRLTGRYVEIPVHPLRFGEFLRFLSERDPLPDRQTAWKLYLRYGGFPGIHYLPLEDDAVFTYLNSLYNTVVLKDVVNRHDVREPAQLDLITRYLFDNCGNLTSGKRIADYLSSQSLAVSVTRVGNYLAFLQDAFLTYRCRRFDLKGKRHLELNDKYYMADVGIRHGLIGYSDRDIAGLLENVVYLELRARGYTVSVGKLRDAEVDFIAERQTERRYIQVSYLLATAETVEREFGVLERIDDNYPKLVLSLDEVQPAARGGIQWRNLVDFLLDDEG